MSTKEDLKRYRSKRAESRTWPIAETEPHAEMMKLHFFGFFLSFFVTSSSLRLIEPTVCLEQTTKRKVRPKHIQEELVVEFFLKALRQAKKNKGGLN